MPLGIAIVLFAIFVGNVALGAFYNAPVVGDVGEMLILLAASLAFVVAILRREAAAKTKD